MNKFTVFMHSLKEKFAEFSPANGVRAAENSIQDVWTGVTHKTAIPEHQRKLDEFKLASGGALIGAGALELNPLAVAGGLIPFLEAYTELRSAGHRYRLQRARVFPN